MIGKITVTESAPMNNFIGLKEIKLGEICQQLQDWLDDVFGKAGLNLEPKLELSIANYTAAISLDDRVIWEDQNCGEPSLDELKREVVSYYRSMSAAFSCE